MTRRTLAIALTATLALTLVGCVAAPADVPQREPVTEVLQWERLPTVKPAGPMSPELARHLDASPEGVNIGLVIRGEEALMQWERASSWEHSAWLELTFTQGDQVIAQILPPDSTWAHVAGVAVGVPGEWRVGDSDGNAVVSGRFSELAFIR